MRRRVFYFLVALMLMVPMVACSQSPAAAPAATVQWSDYAAGLQGKIDGMATAKDCRGLQAEFNTADRNSEATKARTGRNNAELMKYVDTAMKTAGCYK